MTNDRIKFRGELRLVLEREDGTIETFSANLIVNAGLARIALLMTGGGSPMSHMALGGSSTMPGATQTALVSEVGRVALASTTTVTTNVSGDSVQYVATFPAGTATGALTEAGLFDAASGGTMLARSVYNTVNKGENDSLTVTWKVVCA
jgi:hypothetical protein